MLKPKKYLDIIKHTTLTSIDLVIIYKNKILLGLRNNEPAKNYFFVPGCRTYKNETQKEGIKRVGLQELGIEIKKEDIKLLGVFDHIYPNNFDNKNFGTHYVVSAYLIKLEKLPNIKKDNQHEKLHFYDLKELNELNIHKYTKNYLQLIEKLL